MRRSSENVVSDHAAIVDGDTSGCGRSGDGGRFRRRSRDPRQRRQIRRVATTAATRGRWPRCGRRTQSIWIRRRASEFVGRDNIAKHFDYIFAGSEDAQLAVTIDSIDFVSPNVAIEKGTAVVTYSDYPPEETTYSAVHVKRDGKWLIDRVTEEEVPAAAAVALRGVEGA